MRRTDAIESDGELESPMHCSMHSLPIHFVNRSEPVSAQADVRGVHSMRFSTWRDGGNRLYMHSGRNETYARTSCA